MSSSSWSFDDLIGHQPIQTQLSRSQPFAALLFAGPESIGKSLVARWYAAWLNCENPPRQAPWHCDCLSCRRVLNGNHPDVQTLRREEGKLSLGVQEVRDFIHGMALRRYEGRYRVSLIDDAERLTDEAQSALLKTLEEPPPNQILILICSQEFRLLDTVRSRCRLYRLLAPPVAQVVQRLEARGLSSEKAALLARLCEGRLGMALRMSQNERLWSLQEEVLGLLDSLSGASLWSALEVAKALETLKVDESLAAGGFAGARAGAEFHLGMVRLWLRDVLALACSDQAQLLLEHRRAQLTPVAQRWGTVRIGEQLSRLEESRQHLEANVNPRFVLQSLCLALATP